MAGPVRGVVVVVASLVALWVVLVVLAAVFQRQLIHLPDRQDVAAPPGVEEVQLRTDDGLDLTAWYVPGPGEPVSTVLVAPGNAGNRALREPLARGLVARGHAVLLLEYRGYGGNPGSPSEDGLAADARAARAHLDDRDDVDPDRIVYLGESLGTAVVARLSADTPPAVLVLRSPFPELTDVARAAYPFLPVGTLLRDRHPVVAPLEGYDGPLLVVAGDADTIVAPELSRTVAEATGAELVEVAGADHNDRSLLDGDHYLDAVDAHVRAALGDP